MSSVTWAVHKTPFTFCTAVPRHKPQPSRSGRLMVPLYLLWGRMRKGSSAVLRPHDLKAHTVASLALGLFLYQSTLSVCIIIYKATGNCFSTVKWKQEFGVGGGAGGEVSDQNHRFCFTKVLLSSSGSVLKNDWSKRQQSSENALPDIFSLLLCFVCSYKYCRFFVIFCQSCCSIYTF